MRRRRAFCPQVWDALEARIVPSLATMAPPPILMGQTAPLPSHFQNNSEVQEAFDDFARNYVAAVDSVLLARDESGGVDPVANRAAFDSVVKQALETLTRDLIDSLGDESAGSALSIQIVSAILGDGADSLESQLMAISTSTIEDADVSTASLPDDAEQAVQQIESRISAMVGVPVSSAVPQGASLVLVTTTPAFSEDPSVVDISSETLAQVREGFSAFLRDYYRAVRDVLLTSETREVGNAVAARGQFNTRVNEALRILADTVAHDVQSESNSASLTAQVQVAIAGPGADSLQARLASLSTPESLEAATVRAFTVGAFRVVTNVYSLIAGDLS